MFFCFLGLLFCREFILKTMKMKLMTRDNTGVRFVRNPSLLEKAFGTIWKAIRTSNVLYIYKQFQGILGLDIINCLLKKGSKHISQANIPLKPVKKVILVDMPIVAIKKHKRKQSYVVVCFVLKLFLPNRP